MLVIILYVAHHMVCQSSYCMSLDIWYVSRHTISCSIYGMLVIILYVAHHMVCQSSWYSIWLMCMTAVYHLVAGIVSAKS